MTDVLTYGEVAEVTKTDIPAHLEAQATPPLITKAARQGDVNVRRIADHESVSARSGELKTYDLSIREYKVVQGDADRNSQILSGAGTFTPGVVTHDVADYGLLEVPEGGVAYLTHTSEHGTLAFAPGRYRVLGQLSQEEEIRRAAD